MRIRQSDAPCHEILRLRQQRENPGGFSWTLRHLASNFLNSCRATRQHGVKQDAKQSANPTSEPGPSDSERLRQELIQAGDLSIAAQNRMRLHIETLSRRLAGFLPNPLFTFPDLTSAHSAVPHLWSVGAIARPGHLAKLVLADLYSEKYGIRIHVQKDSCHSARELAEMLLQKTISNQGKPVGFVLHSDCKRPLPGTDVRSGQDYLHHVIPLTLQKTGTTIEAINLDVLSKTSSQLLDALSLIRNEGLNVKVLKLNVPQRQADGYSCHTDAMQVLKDALLAHKQTRKSLLASYLKYYGVAQQTTADESSIDNFISTRQINLPPHLQKTVQRSKAMLSTRLTLQKTLSARLASANPQKRQTLEEHRKRYTAWAITTNKPMNHFLLFKGYRNASKVLAQLERFPSPSARHHYLEQLETQFGLA